MKRIPRFIQSFIEEKGDVTRRVLKRHVITFYSELMKLERDGTFKCDGWEGTGGSIYLSNDGGGLRRKSVNLGKTTFRRRRYLFYVKLI